MFFFLVSLEEDVEGCFGLTALIVFLNMDRVPSNRPGSPRGEVCWADAPREDYHANVLLRCNSKPRVGGSIDSLDLEVQTLECNNLASSLLSK